MNLIYETDRLILKVLRPEAAKKSSVSIWTTKNFLKNMKPAGRTIFIP